MNTMTTLKIAQTTAKQTARGMRLWCENRALLEGAGFTACATYTLTLSQVAGKGRALLVINSAGKGRVSKCARAGVVRPIVDLHSKAIAQYFKAGSTVEILAGTDSILFSEV